MIDPKTITAFDVEAWGSRDFYALQPFRALTGNAWLTSAALASYDHRGQITTESIREPTAAELAEWLDTVRGQYVVCWNTPYDVSWLLVLDKLHPHLGIRAKVMAVNWIDGMLLYRHSINAPRYKAEGRESIGLKEAVKKFYPTAAGYEEGVAFQPTTQEEWDKLLDYNEEDCFYTLGIVTHLIKTLPKPVLRCALIEARCLPLVADTKVEGVRLNAEKAAALGEVLRAKRDTALVLLTLQHGMLEWEKIIRSAKQLRELLYETWGLPVPHLTDGGEPSTDKEALTILGVSDDRAKLIYTVRECQNRDAKFAQGALQSLDYNGDGCSRPEFRTFATYTGRGTYTSRHGRTKKEQDENPIGIALHQWVNDPEYRALVEVDEDSELIEADFAGQEFRWMAVESGDPVMLDLCKPGEDAHAFMGHRIQPELEYRWIQAHRDDDPVAKAIRKMGKVGNLSAQYRTGWVTLRKIAAVQHGVKLDPNEADLVIRTYKKTYRRVPRYWNRQIQFAKLNGYVQTLGGRRVNLGDYKTWRYIDPEGDHRDEIWAHESTAINFPIQGVGADQKYLALLVARNYLPTVGGRFLMELHDGMFFRVPRGVGERAAREIRQLLSNLPYERAWGLPSPLPTHFPVDVKRGPSWGALKEIEA